MTVPEILDEHLAKKLAGGGGWPLSLLLVWRGK
jgi:hypothetical protein